MNLLKQAICLALATAGIAGAARAQLVTDECEHDPAPYTYGGGLFGGAVDGNAKITHEYLTGQAANTSNMTMTARAEKRVTLFGNNKQAALLGFDAENARYAYSGSGSSTTAAVISGYMPSTSAFLNIAGQTIAQWNPPAQSATYLNVSWNQSWSADTQEFDKTYHPLGIPITVKAKASASAYVGFGVIATYASLSVYGNAGASALGSASATVNLLVATAGVKGKLEFAAPSMDLGAGANASAGIYGNFVLTAGSVDLWLKAFVHRYAVTLRGWTILKAKTHCWYIFNWSTGGHTLIDEAFC